MIRLRSRALPAILFALLPAAALAAGAKHPPAPLAGPEVHRRSAPRATALDLRMRTEPGYAATHPEEACGTTRTLYEVSRYKDAARREANLKGGPRPKNAKVYVKDRIVVIENDGKIMRDDRPPDLAGKAMTLTASGDGFQATLGPAAWAPPVSTALFSDRTSGFESYPVQLPWNFQFGSKSYNQVWMTNTGGVFFAPPTAPTTTQMNESRDLFDRTPRIAPLLGGTSYYGYTGYVDKGFAWVILTWATADLEMQVTLSLPDKITITWNKLNNVLHGSVAVVTGNDAFWASEAEVASWGDPVDVTLGKPEDGALDVTAVHVRQVPGTQVLHFVLDLVAPPPTTGGKQIYYELMYHPDPASPTQTAYEYVVVVDGRITEGTAWGEVKGSSIEIGVPLSRINVPGRDFDLRLNTWLNDGGWIWADAAFSPLISLPTTGRPPMLDLSVDLPRAVLGPLYEAFTIPALDVYLAYEAYRQAFGDPPVDSVAFFQNIYTDIIFYAGAYSTVGNAQVNGIGVGSKSDPPWPALLHMNTIGYGWNANEGGRTCVLNQEFGHHYAYFARFKENNVTSTILNPDGAHPAPWVHTPAPADVLVTPDFSSFGGSFWQDRGAGKFKSATSWSGTSFWGVELYTLGLVAPGEVADWWYIKDPVPGFGGQIGYWSPANMDQAGTKTMVTIQQIIDNEGPRDPAFPDASRNFRVPFVLVVRPGSLQDSHSQTVEQYCTEWEKNFPVSTLMRGKMSCFSGCVAPVEAVGNTLYLVKSRTAGKVWSYWRNLTNPVSDYAVLEGPSKSATLTNVAGTGADGVAGVEYTPTAGSPVFYRVAGRNLPDCVGPQ